MMKPSAISLPKLKSNAAKLTHCQIGVGLRPTHYTYLEKNPPQTTKWFEAISENYMGSFGNPRKVLRQIRRDFPVALHGVSLSIASTDPLNTSYLDSLKRLVDEIRPFIVSDHLCWTGVAHQNLHDLLPLPFTHETLHWIVPRIQKVQETLGREILLENVSSYLQVPHNEMTEWEFLKEISLRSGCKILLDINNAYVNSYNHRFNPQDYLQSIPLDRIGQIHLAGFTDKGSYLFDTHSKPVFSKVWDLFSDMIQKIPHVPILIEWDDDIPDFEILELEAQKAVTIWKSHHDKT